METRESLSCKTLTFVSFLLHHMIKKVDGFFGILASFAFAICLCFIWYSSKKESKRSLLKKI